MQESDRNGEQAIETVDGIDLDASEPELLASADDEVSLAAPGPSASQRGSMLLAITLISILVSLCLALGFTAQLKTQER